MYRYGQYCPVAKATEILGDRWTLLIVRDLLTGTTQFNEFERGLPGISRGLLSDRLQRLHRMGIVEKVENGNGRYRTSYHLTQAGQELQPVIGALLTWGAKWAFGEPALDDLDPILLLWWMRSRVQADQLPSQRIVVQFDFVGAVKACYWLLLTKEDSSVCLTHPGFEIDVLVTADITTFFQVWLGRQTFPDAVANRMIEIDAIPVLSKAFPAWFAYSHAAPAVRAAVTITAGLGE